MNMDEMDVFDGLYRSHERAVAILLAAQELGESAGTDNKVMLFIETALELLKNNRVAWEVIEKAVCRAG